MKRGAERKSKILKIRVEPRLYALLTKEAFSRGRTISEVARLHLRKSLLKGEKEK